MRLHSCIEGGGKGGESGIKGKFIESEREVYERG